MIWFGDLNRILPAGDHPGIGRRPERERMRLALEYTAERAPQLEGPALLDALAASGWVNRDTAARLIHEFRSFDPDRHFAEYLRRLSFRGHIALDQFRAGVRSVFDEITDAGELGEIGPEQAIRFRCGDKEGIVLAHPEVAFTISGDSQAAISAAIEEMPDVLVVVARNFQSGAAGQLSGILHGTEVPGTLVTVNLLLGIRAMTLRYRPAGERLVELLGAGRPLRSADIARLGDRSQSRSY